MPNAYQKWIKVLFTFMYVSNLVWRACWSVAYIWAYPSSSWILDKLGKLKINPDFEHSEGSIFLLSLYQSSSLR